jgi:molecular chaperone HscA
MNGLDVGSARKTLDDLAGVLDSQRQAVRFLEQPVLEAVAAATGVQDKLVNQRPQVVVIDVGAGTTDLGVFKYAVVEDAARVSPYKNGMRALRIAGNRLDDALIELAWNRLQLADDSQVKKMFVRRLRADVRDLKRDFMRDGRIHIEVEGFAPVDLDLDEFEAHAMVSSFVRQFESEVISALNGAGVGSKNFLESSEPNLAVFTGGGAGLPFLRRIFDRPIKLSNGEALFELRNPEPEWLELYTADVRAVFPQIAVSTGGCAPNLPDEKSAVMDTSTAHPRHLEPMYKV